MQLLPQSTLDAILNSRDLKSIVVENKLSEYFIGFFEKACSLINVYRFKAWGDHHILTRVARSLHF